MGVDFNSGTMFNGRLYFASTAGLTREGGGRDNELDIKAWVTVSTADMSIMKPKALRTLALSGRFGGRIRVVVESEARSEAYISPELSGMTGLRMGLDRDLRGWMQKFKIENYDGSSVNLSRADITIIPGPEFRR